MKETKPSGDGRIRRDNQLCWTRAELVQATGLSYRTISNFERRGLLDRCSVGISTALYTDSSVKKLFLRNNGQAS